MTDQTTREGGFGDTAGPRRATAGKHLTFVVGSEVYGIDVLDVQEIIRMTDITRVPRTPRAVRGVINLRGKITPVIDLRVKFGLSGGADSERTCIVVVRPKGDGESLAFGLVVDEVRDVLDLSEDEIDEAPALAGELPAFVLSIGKTVDAVIVLLDARLLVSGEEAEVVEMCLREARETEEVAG